MPKRRLNVCERCTASPKPGPGPGLGRRQTPDATLQRVGRDRAPFGLVAVHQGCRIVVGQDRVDFPSGFWGWDQLSGRAGPLVLESGAPWRRYWPGHSQCGSVRWAATGATPPTSAPVSGWPNPFNVQRRMCSRAYPATALMRFGVEGRAPTYAA
ncbi:hypothetical protein TPA0910_52440 [Streptomyces hygroscopicus subsp. sporocinereus]|uniref:Uncharacterized protein n=1 Tax=Streptomyces hygroscopicus TaxID=1912 RepID=A0ABQ3U5Y8_STRHY|nr:hypothetical protein TPA0910_52440 [Streptomyces hygroscopicus]